MKSILSQGEYELHVEFNHGNLNLTTKYGIFDIGDYAHNYKLSVGLPKEPYGKYTERQNKVHANYSHSLIQLWQSVPLIWTIAICSMLTVRSYSQLDCLYICNEKNIV